SEPSELDRALEQERVRERLRQIPAELPLPDVELLGQQAGWPARRPVALEPSRRSDVVALLGAGEREPEAAEDEGAFCGAERPRVGAVPVGVAVLRQLTLHCFQRRDRAWVLGRESAADGRQEERRVDAAVRR